MEIEVILQLLEKLDSTAITEKNMFLERKSFAEDMLPGTPSRQEVSSK